MKGVLVALLTAALAAGQARTASIAGTVLDAQTLKPITAALVTAVRSGLPPLSMHTKSGGDGAFEIPGLDGGQYSLCVQAADSGYLDPCQWSGSAAQVTLVPGQAAMGVTLRLEAAALVRIQVEDVARALSGLTRDGRRPELSVGVWGPNGLYYPARAVGGAASIGSLASVISFEAAAPREVALKLSIASRDLRLGDGSGAALPGNASQQAFRHAAGDPQPKVFRFTVLGLLP